MVAIHDNYWGVKGNDNLNRTHIPAQPLWVFIIRIAQLVLSIIIIGLTGNFANKVDGHIDTWSGIAFSFFCFAWTLLYLGWLGASTLFWPIAYHWIAHVVVEGLSVVFWLACWADLAANASNLNQFTSNDASSAAAQAAAQAAAEGIQLTPAEQSEINSAVGSENTVNSTINGVKAAAGLGALEWLLFIATTVHLVIVVIAHYKSQARPGTNGVEAGAVETKPQPAVEMAPAPQPGYPQQPYPQQAAYPQQPYPQQPQAYPPQQYPPQEGYPQQQPQQPVYPSQ